MKRNVFDKSCYQAVTGKMYRLQQLFNLPIIANDTVSINLAGVFKLSKLRRWLALDANLHIAFYFVKHRWVYKGTSGPTWDEFIKKSIRDEQTTPSTLETKSIGWPLTPNDFFGTNQWDNITVPAHYVDGPLKIWNRYYRAPNVTDELPLTAADWITGTMSPQDYAYGLPVCRLPALWTTGVPAANMSSDPTVFTETGAGSFDLLDIAQIQAQYQDEVDRDWFSHRYQDLMQQKWGSNGVTNEVDDTECELLYDWSGWASGVDIHGTDASSLGSYVGKVQMPININMPPRYFNEHGTLFAFATCRFPSICTDEIHYNYKNTLNSDNFLLYPEAVRSKPPVEMTEADMFTDGDAGQSYGMQPYANWMRFNPNRISTDFKSATGFPFEKSTDVDNTTYTYGASANTPIWDQTTTADSFFANVSELAHWNIISKAEIEVRSTLPNANESLFAGARHIN